MKRIPLRNLPKPMATRRPTRKAAKTDRKRQIRYRKGNRPWKPAATSREACCQTKAA